MKRWTAGLACLAVAGCSTPSIDAIGPAPVNYKAAVKDRAFRSFFDPQSIRDASISKPFHGRTVANYNWESGMGWVVCLKANTKTRFGAYTGLQETVYIF